MLKTVLATICFLIASHSGGQIPLELSTLDESLVFSANCLFSDKIKRIDILDVESEKKSVVSFASVSRDRSGNVILIQGSPNEFNFEKYTLNQNFDIDSAIYINNYFQDTILVHDEFLYSTYYGLLGSFKKTLDNGRVISTEFRHSFKNEAPQYISPRLCGIKMDSDFRISREKSLFWEVISFESTHDGFIDFEYRQKIYHHSKMLRTINKTNSKSRGGMSFQTYSLKHVERKYWEITKMNYVLRIYKVDDLHYLTYYLNDKNEWCVFRSIAITRK